MMMMNTARFLLHRPPNLPSTRWLATRSFSPSCSLLNISNPTASVQAVVEPNYRRTISATADRNRMVFKVSKVKFHDGSIETINMHASELVAQHKSSFRDLFFTLSVLSKTDKKKKISPQRRRTTTCAIVPRKDVIVVSFGNTVRAVIGLEQVLLFDAHSPAVQSFAQELSTTLQSVSKVAKEEEGSHESGNNSSEEPYELIVLEHILKDTVDAFQRRLRLFEPIVDNHDFSSSPNDANTSIHQLAPLKDALQSFKMQVHQSEECLETILQQDDTMVSLLLTEQHAAAASGHAVALARHEHVEILLGVYAREISHVQDTLTYLLQRIQSKQEFVALSYSGYRNRMIRLNVLVGIAGVSLGVSTAVAGFFGMNLISGYEETAGAFPLVVALAAGSSVAVSSGCLAFLSGSALSRQAAVRMQETEQLTRALNVMSTLDYTMKTVLDESSASAEQVVISREQFRDMLQAEKVSQRDADVLFNVFDRIKDGNLTAQDFRGGE